ncbi:DNA/RNA helicase domain-containing protein [Leptolyngbya sp. AN03gr2]|uniref:DNA/RNA helicase domain-containing protein n=1 Tax=unclassified Leptolyngbya TaxID=2650499 RepID=UPI003D311AD4
MSVQYGWLGSIADFLACSPSDWLATLQANYQALYQMRSTGTQNQAWEECGEILRSQFANFSRKSWTLIFEYELPGEGGRRPDLIILGSGQILVFEFKQKSTLSNADLDQVAAYGRDLSEYHQASANHPVSAILIPTRYTKENAVRNTVQILNPTQIAIYLESLSETQPEIDSNQWVNSTYEPLPTVIAAARRIFQQEPLPSIRRAQSAKIPEILDYLRQIVDRASTQKERHLILITGVPGAGKTLVGLQFVYDSDRPAIFLSGNRPLITVLQYALKSKAFVREIRNFYLQHEARRQSAPRENIIVFDEAQRAWDADRMSEKYGISSAAPGAVLRICERVPDWCVLLGLIGEGQTIHVGEEGGIQQWNEGLNESWQVHCSSEQAQCFDTTVHTNDLLNLTTSLRSHLAHDVQIWVAHVLNGEIDQAQSVIPLLIQEGFNAYLTRNLEVAKNYCRSRYQDQSDKRYGLVASSRSRNLVKYGIRNDYISTQKLNIGAWYIDSPDSENSCCTFDRVVTEFSCQGLELDFPIVGWGDDLIWKDEAWITTTRQKNVRDPLQLRLNSYRVLLTRGRDGFILYVPPETKMDRTFEILRSSGLSLLSDEK